MAFDIVVYCEEEDFDATLTELKGYGFKPTNKPACYNSDGKGTKKIMVVGEIDRLETIRVLKTTPNVRGIASSTPTIYL